MKKRLLGFGLILFPILVVIYYTEMKYGWQQVIKIISTTGMVCGILILGFMVVLGIGLLLGEDYND